ncbi:MAG: N5-glutamine methyltransferase family protein [Candidatus Nanopelagicales bacterium]
MNRREDLIADASARFERVGIETPRVDAELLLAHVLGVSRGDVHKHTTVDEDEVTEFEKLVKFRETRIPVQHLTGKGYFRYLEVRVGPGVLIPRPETELIVDAVKSFRTLSDPLLIVDLGSGAAALTISLAIECAPADVIGVELYDDAFRWSEVNVKKYETEIFTAGSSVHLVQADFATVADTELSELLGKVDVVVSNPPYIPIGGIPRDAEVHLYEPSTALYGGVGGLELVEQVIETASKLLKPGGLLVIEHSDFQGEGTDLSVPESVRRVDMFDSVKDNLDLNQRPRYTTAVRMS